ncbi:RHS repeat-associated core domain-containing protein [Candidatus Acetothermia bacterium]|nr:RHS repeat-associated core domain-containing protein [Candidatus Acetothermia bacterium]
MFALTDTTGKIVEGYQYDAYGRQTVFAPGPNGVVNFGGGDVVTPGVSTVNNPYMYTGRRLDTETLRLDTGIGLYYYRTRYVDTDEGRFISRDTIGFEGGINLYEYVDSEPTAYTDPIGMQKCCCCCIVDAEIKNSKQINDATTWGHSFDVEIKLEYKESDKASDCTLQWWEKTDLMPQWQKDAGLKDNDWNDIYKAFPTSSTFDGWRTGRKKPCPGNETATITDPPALTKVSGRNASRTLYFAIWLKSAPDCPCSNPFKNKVLFANQKLTMKEGKGDAQSFGTAGVPGPWPPPLEEELQKLIKGK